jgi:pentatricopeptide repeat protein
MVGQGIRPDALSGASVMEALAAAGRWREAFEFFEKVKAQGVRPDIKWHTQALSQTAVAGRCVGLLAELIVAVVGKPYQTEA